jgi:shikimate kinase
MNKKGDHIILIGMSGAGKTTTGEALSISLNLPFIDTDEEIVKITGLSIPEIFRLEGEAKFRSYESGVIRQLVDFPKSVISVGGGLPCYDNQIELLLEMGTVVHLDVSIDVLAKRLGKNTNSRPLFTKLSSNQIVEKTKTLMKQRTPFYRKADLIIDGNHSSGDLVKKVIEKTH